MPFFRLLAVFALQFFVQAQSVSFQDRVEIPVGNAQLSVPQDAAFADLNHDGFPDVVLADTQRTALLILPGTALGRFGAARKLALPNPVPGRTVAFSVLTIELNGDELPDVVVATRNPNQLLFYRSKGDFLFDDPVQTALDRMPMDLEGSDFDGNGKQEVMLLTSAYTTSTGEKLIAGVSLYALDESGRFIRLNELPLTNTSGYAHKADFDGDGQMDLAVRNGSGVSVLLNSLGVFRIASTSSPASSPGMFSHGDFNGDDKEDIAIPCRQSKAVYVLFGNGDGSFRDGPVVSIAGRPSWSGAADFNGDGRADVVAGMTDATTQVVVMLNKGDGTFDKSAEFVLIGELSFVDTPDLNGDGKPELVVATGMPGSAAVFLNDGAGRLRRGQTLGALPVAMKTLDVDLDKVPDLAVLNAVLGEVSILKSGRERAGDFPVGTVPFSMALGDINGDGRTDVTTANLLSMDLSALIGSESRVFEDARTTSVQRLISAIALADWDGDGKLDAALAEETVIQFWAGQGDGSFQSAGEVPATYPMFLAQADFNHDSKPDLAVADLTPLGPVVRVLKGTGSFAFESGQSLVAASDVKALTTADLNTDGHPDLVFLRQYPNVVDVALGNGDATFRPPLTTQTSASASDMAIADFDGDGKLDVAIGGDSSGRGALMRGRGDGTFLAPSGDFGVDGGSSAIAAGDWNGDGRIDLALADSEHGSVSIFRNVEISAFAPGPPLIVSPKQDFIVEQSMKGGLASCRDPAMGLGFTLVLLWEKPIAPLGVREYLIRIQPPTASLKAVELTADGSSTMRWWVSCDVIPDAQIEGWSWTIRAVDPEGRIGPASEPGTFRFTTCRLADGSPCAGAQ